jgi:hypothetical protein
MFQINKLLIPSSSIYVNSYESGRPFSKGFQKTRPALSQRVSKNAAGPFLKGFQKCGRPFPKAKFFLQKSGRPFPKGFPKSGRPFPNANFKKAAGPLIKGIFKKRPQSGFPFRRGLNAKRFSLSERKKATTSCGFRVEIGRCYWASCGSRCLLADVGRCV